MRYLAENPGLEDRLRADRSLIPEFIEEVLRLQGTTKSTFRYARKPVTVGGVDIAPGTHVMLHFSGMNRDGRKFADPQDFRVPRDGVRQHVAFGRGIHACAGAPLARAEARVARRHPFQRRLGQLVEEAAAHVVAGLAVQQPGLAVAQVQPVARTRDGALGPWSAIRRQSPCCIPLPGAIQTGQRNNSGREERRRGDGTCSGDT